MNIMPLWAIPILKPLFHNSPIPWLKNTHVQEIPHLLRNLNIHHRVHKSLPWVPNYTTINPIQTFHAISVMSRLLQSLHLGLGLPNGILPLDFSW